jgi:NAD(P)-dependent dehydrogenase (short-subunit alcohol dehydrogenase family)
MPERMDVVPGLVGKSAIVWGGGASMGFSTAERLGASGCRVALVDVDGDLAEQSAAQLRGRGVDAIGLRADVTREADVETAVDRAAAAIGLPQLSASVVGRATSYGPLLETSLTQWEADQRLNLLPMFLIGRTIARRLVASGQTGSMAFITSISGLQAAHHHASYGAAKRAMTALAQTMAMEWGPLGIRVNTVAPGAIHTQRVQPSDAMIELLRQKVPAGRFAQVDEMANCLLFMLSDMSSYVNGQTLVADGGWMTVPPIRPDDNPRLPESAPSL